MEPVNPVPDRGCHRRRIEPQPTLFGTPVVERTGAGVLTDPLDGVTKIPSPSPGTGGRSSVIHKSRRMKFAALSPITIEGTFVLLET